MQFRVQADNCVYDAGEGGNKASLLALGQPRPVRIPRSWRLTVLQTQRSTLPKGLKVLRCCSQPTSLSTQGQVVLGPFSSRGYSNSCAGLQIAQLATHRR